MKYTSRYLLNKKIISSSQFDDLVIEKKNIRIWKSRMTIEDGMKWNDTITIEFYNGNAWITKKEVNPHSVKEITFNEDIAEKLKDL